MSSITIVLYRSMKNVGTARLGFSIAVGKMGKRRCEMLGLVRVTYIVSRDISVRIIYVSI